MNELEIIQHYAQTVFPTNATRTELNPIESNEFELTLHLGNASATMVIGIDELMVLDDQAFWGSILRNLGDRVEP